MVGRRLPTSLLVVACTCLVGIVLFARVPGSSRILAVLNDAAHAPVFGAIALIALALLRPWLRPLTWRIASAFAIACVLGAGVEWLQSLVGRSSSWKDVGTDALGAAFALGAAAWRIGTAKSGSERVRWRVTAAGLMALSGSLVLYPVAEASTAYVVRAWQFPDVVRFARPLDLYFLQIRSAEAEHAMPLPDLWAEPGDPPSLRLRTTGGDWPGLAVEEPSGDWRGYTVLRVDITNPDSRPLAVTVRVHDATHDQRHADRFNQAFSVPGRSRRVLAMTLAEIEQGPEARLLDLGRIAGLVVFAGSPAMEPTRDFYVTRIWLE